VEPFGSINLLWEGAGVVGFLCEAARAADQRSINPIRRQRGEMIHAWRLLRSCPACRFDAADHSGNEVAHHSEMTAAANPI
jgi:hypothetical protein